MIYFLHINSVSPKSFNRTSPENCSEINNIPNTVKNKGHMLPNE